MSSRLFEKICETLPSDEADWLVVIFCFTEIPASDWSVMRGRLVGGGVHLWQTAGVLHGKGGSPAFRGVCASY